MEREVHTQYLVIGGVTNHACGFLGLRSPCTSPIMIIVLPTTCNMYRIYSLQSFLLTCWQFVVLGLMATAAFVHSRVPWFGYGGKRNE